MACTTLNQQQQRTLKSLRILPGKTVRHCEHVKSNGELCGSPALRGRNYCYFHLTEIGRRLRTARSAAADCNTPLNERAVELNLPTLEDAHSIQIAIGQVIDAILHNRIDTKRAGLVLYALQTASCNLNRDAQLECSDGAMVAAQYDAFEQDFELGEDAPQFKVEEAPPEIQEEEHEAAVTAKVRSLVEALDRIEADKKSATIRGRVSEMEDGSQTFVCDPLCQILCEHSAENARQADREAAEPTNYFSWLIARPPADAAAADDPQTGATSQSAA